MAKNWQRRLWMAPHGGVHKLRLQNLAFFLPPTPLCLHFLWYKSLQNVNLFEQPTLYVRGHFHYIK